MQRLSDILGRDLSGSSLGWTAEGGCCYVDGRVTVANPLSPHNCLAENWQLRTEN